MLLSYTVIDEENTSVGVNPLFPSVRKGSQIVDCIEFWSVWNTCLIGGRTGLP